MTYGSYDRRRRRPRRRDAAGSSFAERVRRARERLQAQQAAQAQLAEVAQRSAPLEPPLITSAPTPEPQRSLLENLRGAFPFLDPVGQARDMAQEVRRGNFLGALTRPATSAIGLMDQATRNVAAPAGSATIGLFPTADRSLLGELRQGLGSGVLPVGAGTIGAILNRLSGDDLAAEERRRSKSRAALPDFLGRIGKKEGPRWLPGFVSPLESSRVLAGAQVERPMPLQIVSETISPVGIAEAFIPIGKFRSAIKPVSKHLTIGAKRPGVAQRVIELPPSEKIIDMVIPEGGIQRGESWFGRGVGKVVGTVSRNAVADASDPVTRVETYNQLMPELVRDAANGQVSLVLRNGRANDVFEVVREGTRVQRLFGAFEKQVPGPVKYRVIRKEEVPVARAAVEGVPTTAARVAALTPDEVTELALLNRMLTRDETALTDILTDVEYIARFPGAKPRPYSVRYPGRTPGSEGYRPPTKPGYTEAERLKNITEAEEAVTVAEGGVTKANKAISDEIAIAKQAGKKPNKDDIADLKEELTTAKSDLSDAKSDLREAKKSTAYTAEEKAYIAAADKLDVEYPANLRARIQRAQKEIAELEAKAIPTAPAAQIVDVPVTPAARVAGEAVKEVVDFTEIAQFPERFALNPTQMKWLDDFDESTRNLMEYARKVGAVEDSLLTENKVKGRYFPNFWKFFDGELMDDLTGVKPSLAVKQNFEKSRFYEEARDAVATGFNGGDPDEAVAILYKSIYKRIGDKHLENMVRPLGNTIDSRIGDQLIKARDATIKRQKGVRTAKGIIGQYSVSSVLIGPGRMITKGPRKGTVVRKSLRGRTEAEREAPELMEAFWKASAMSGPERVRAFKALKARASLLEKGATATANSAKDAVAIRRKAARPSQGEVQLPMSGISDVVFTAKEDAKRVFQQFDEWGQKVSGGAKGTTDLSREQLNRLEAVLAPEAQQDWWRGLTSGAAAVSTAARTAMAATDIGAPMIHGLPVLLTKPGVWSEAATAALEIWKNPAVMARYIDAHWDTYQKLLSRNGVHGGGSEYVEALQQGGILQQLVSKGGQAPVVGPAARGVEAYLSGAERNFNGFILISKMLMYEALEPVAIRKGGEAALDQLVSHVGKLTGTVSMANMGTNPTMRELLGGFVLFAPRYRMAIYGLMKDVFDFKNFRGELARESLGKMLTGGLIAYSVIATKAHQKPKLDPRKSDFLTLEIGDSNIGIGSGFVSLAKFTAALLAGGGKDFEFTAKNILGHMADKTGRFVRGQSAPTSSMGWDLVSGRNYIGEPTKGVMPLLENSIATHITPFWLQGLMDMPRPGWHASVAEFGGMRTFPVSSYERAVDAADIHSQAAYNLNFRELNRLQQETIRRDNPGVQAMFDESSRVWRERGRADEITLYREEQKKVRDIYDEEISKKIALLVTGRIDAKQLRDSVSAAGAYMRLAYSSMEENHPEAIEALNAERQNPDAHIEDIAYTDYIKTVIAGDFEDPETGIFDYQARARAEAMWREAYGENVWAYVQQRRNLKVESLLQELYQGRTRYRPYYEAGEQILKQMGAEALTRKWHQYVKARGVDKELIELEYPVFKQVQRVQSKVRILMRERNAELDAHMYRWQYADKLRHPANEGRERELLSYE